MLSSVYRKRALSFVRLVDQVPEDPPARRLFKEPVWYRAQLNRAEFQETGFPTEAFRSGSFTSPILQPSPGTLPLAQSTIVRIVLCSFVFGDLRIIEYDSPAGERSKSEPWGFDFFFSGAEHPAPVWRGVLFSVCITAQKWPSAHAHLPCRRPWGCRFG